MTDVERELQKLRALINQKQTTAIFSNKSNESTKLLSGDTELFINDMSKRFSFSRAGVRNPVAIDPREKAIYNLDYLNGAKVSDITGSAFAIDELRDITSKQAERITTCEQNIDKNASSINEIDGRVDVCDNDIDDINIELLEHATKLDQQSARIDQLEKIGEVTEIMTDLETRVGEHDAVLQDITTNGISLDKRVNKTVTETPISTPSYSYSYDNDTQIVTIVIDAPVNIEDLAEGSKALVDIIWAPSSGSGLWGDVVSYNKKFSFDDTTYTFSWANNDVYHVRLVDGVIKFNRPSSINSDYNTIKSLVLATDRFVTRSAEFCAKDNGFTKAVVNSLADELLPMNEEITYDEIPITIGSVSWSYTPSTCACVIYFGVNVGPDNLKYGTKVKFATLVVRKRSTASSYTDHKRLIRYTKIQNGDSYDLTWYWDENVVDGITFSDGVWADENGNIFKNLGKINTSQTNLSTFEKDIYFNFEPIKTQTTRPSSFRDILVEFLYPVGSLYVSFDATSPAERFGVGTWESIVNRFLYCSDESGTTGGSRLITIENLPAHSHGILSRYDDLNYNVGFTDTLQSPYNSMPSDTGANESDKRRTTYTENVGSGAEYMPEYMTVFAWRRTA